MSGAWLPLLIDGNLEEIETQKWVKLHALCAVGPLVGLPTGSAVLATMSLILIIGNRSQIKTKGLHAGLLLLWPIIGFLVFSSWVCYWFPLLDADYLRDDVFRIKIAVCNIPSQDIEYYTRQLDWHTRIAGAGILGVGVMGLIHSLRNFKEPTLSEHDSRFNHLPFTIRPSVVDIWSIISYPRLLG